MKPCLIIKNVIVSLSLSLTLSIANADEFSGHIGGFIGVKALNSSDWPDLDTHNSLGFIFDIKKDGWPVSIALDVIDTGGKHKHDGLEDLGHSTEFHLGARKIFINPRSKVQPYIGGGVSFMSAEIELQANNTTMTQDDSDVGVWVGAGMYYEINPEFVFGFDARYSQGDVVLFDKERDAGGIFAGATVGYQF